jgi:hypothetical protein
MILTVVNASSRRAKESINWTMNIALLTISNNPLLLPVDIHLVHPHRHPYIGATKSKHQKHLLSSF